jgi:hypothetical protein
MDFFNGQWTICLYQALKVISGKSVEKFPVCIYEKEAGNENASIFAGCQLIKDVLP